MTVVHVIDLPRNLDLPAEIDTLEGQEKCAARGWFVKMAVIAARTGRKNPIERSFLGSVTRRRLRDTACDVPIVRPIGNPT